MRRKNLLGLRFGRLEVIAYVGLKPKAGKNRSYWLCRCDCGKEKEFLGQSLYSDGTQSCGCLHKELVTERGKKNTKGMGIASFNTLYGKYKYQAFRRGHDFNLSVEEFKDITQRDCHYCGSSPSSECKTKSHTGIYLYNGIDRVDNTQGYNKENCVPCCEICNKAKRDLTVEQFYNWIERVHERRHST